MSTLRVDNIQLNQEGNASISIANSYNVVFTTDGIERVKISKDGFNLAGTGALKVPTGNTAVRPPVPEPGQIRYNTTTGKFEGYGSKWAAIGSGAEIGDGAPSNSGSGDLWWNSSDGKMYIYYVDANSSQWVDISAGTGGQYLPLTGGTVSGNVSVAGEFNTVTNRTGFSGIRIDNSNLDMTTNVVQTGIDFYNSTNYMGRISTIRSNNEFRIVNNQDARVAIYANNKFGAAVTGAGVLEFDSGYGAVRAAYGCRAWVNFNGQGTVAIRGSGGVSSIADNGTGKYAVNFSSALIDTNASIIGMQYSATTTNPSVGDRLNIDGFISSVNEGRIFVSDSSTQSFYDPANINVAVFR